MRDASTEIVEAVARRKGIEPEELSISLYETIDPDALDTLLAGNSMQATFEYAGYRVTADSNGGIELTPLAAP